MREVAPSGPGNERQVGKRAGWPHARTSSGGVRATARKADLGQGGALSLKYSEITPGTKLREQVTRRSLGERSARVIGPTQVGRGQDPRPPANRGVISNQGATRTYSVDVVAPFPPLPITEIWLPLSVVKPVFW